MQIVDVKNVSKHYYQYKVFSKGKLLTKALTDVSFGVKKGDFFGLLGRNGAGKSTLLKILTTNLKKTSGTIKINNYNIDTNETAVKQHISWMFGVDYTGVNWSSVEKNLKLAAAFLGLSKHQTDQRITELLHYFDLYKKRKLDVWRLSTGLAGRYSLCVAMLKDPEVLFLDEPLLGLDFEAKEMLSDVLKQLNKDGTTIIYTDQQLHEVEKLCKNVVMIDEGKKMYDGSIARLKQTYRDAGILEIRATSPTINAILHALEKRYSFVLDYTISTSIDNTHEFKIITNKDSKQTFFTVLSFLQKHHVAVEKANAGVLGLEDIFKQFLHKNKTQRIATHVHAYALTGEHPPQNHRRYLQDKNESIKAAACCAFWNHHQNTVTHVLERMLLQKKPAKIEAIKAIGTAKMHRFVSHLDKELRSADKEIQLHSALALAKLGYAKPLPLLVTLLLDPDTCTQVLDHLALVPRTIIDAIAEQLHSLQKQDQTFIVYHIDKHPQKEALHQLLTQIPQQRYQSRFRKEKK